jgi:hypothetical protein
LNSYLFLSIDGGESWRIELAEGYWMRDEYRDEMKVNYDSNSIEPNH